MIVVKACRLDEGELAWADVGRRGLFWVDFCGVAPVDAHDKLVIRTEAEEAALQDRLSKAEELAGMYRGLLK